MESPPVAVTVIGNHRNEVDDSNESNTTDLTWSSSDKHVLFDQQSKLLSQWADSPQFLVALTLFVAAVVLAAVYR